MRRLALSACTLVLASCSGGIEEQVASTRTATAPDPALSPTTFVSPPKSYAPRTWFHVMSQNMSAEGITKDLEAIADVGLGGITLFHVTQGVPIADLKFASEEHFELLVHLVEETNRLGLSFGVHNSDGWTSSGGPWVTPEQSMKKVVTASLGTDGGAVDLALPQPETLEGFYRDIAVLAYPRSAAEEGDGGAVVPVYASSVEDADLALLSDGEKLVRIALDGTPDAPAWIEVAFPAPVTIQTVNATLPDSRDAKTSLHVESPDGGFVRVADLPLDRPGKKEWALNARVPATTGTRFRLVAESAVNVSELALRQTETFEGVLGRTGVARTSVGDFADIGTPVGEVIDPDGVVDLTAGLTESGRLAATLPEGRWTILRVGMTSTGAVNIPASKEGEGLETDKFDADVTRMHYDAFVGRLSDRAPVDPDGPVAYAQIDSYEVGGQNWTQGFEAMFEDRFGYSLVPYLPAYAGHFVGSPEETEAVLSDTRRLAADLITKNYYRAFADAAAEDGFKTIIEPYGYGPFNDLDAGGQADVPMGEFWMQYEKWRVGAAVSAANIYGRDIISAEAFTSFPEINWAFHPGMAKAEGDVAWAMGINEFTFHRFAHQANTHVMPGMVMNRWGANFDRTQAWWEDGAAAWVEYLTRGQYLLRQGKPSKSLLIFVGDEAPVSCPDPHRTDGLFPEGLTYDCVNAEILRMQTNAVDGRIGLDSEASYDAMMLLTDGPMSQDSLDALATLASAGVPIVGARPAGLLDSWVAENAKARFNAVVDEIWAEPTTYLPSAWQQAVSAHDLRSAARLAGGTPTAHLRRRADDADLYFLPSVTTEDRTMTLTVETAWSEASLWDAMTGAVYALPSEAAGPGERRVTLDLPVNRAAFLVFSDTPYADEPLPAPASRVVATASGAWSVSFDKTYGNPPADVRMETLTDLSGSSVAGVPNYSGRIRYETSFELPGNANEAPLMLDLGEVAVSATVTLNGKRVGTAWAAPYRLDVSGVAKTGRNDLVVDVATLWTNRLIGDAGLPDTDGFEPAEWWPSSRMPDWYQNNEPPTLGQRVTFATANFYDADDPLVPAGLIGPVTIREGGR